MSLNGFGNRLNVFPVRNADGNAGSKAPMAPCSGWTSGCGCSGYAFQSTATRWPSENTRKASFWPPPNALNELTSK